MIAQMADRCYLEKCRDRLYAEFVLGGVALPMAAQRRRAQVKYASGLDLLRQTPEFVAEVRSQAARRRSSTRAYRYLEVLFGGSNPVHRGDRPQRRVPAADPAQRELAPAAPEPAGLRRAARPDDDHARR